MAEQPVHRGAYARQRANGKVYLVHRAGVRERYALKVGYDALDLQSEINVLNALKEQMPNPYLVEADDHHDGSGEVSFYVMRYIEGSPLHHFIRKRGADWIGLIGLKSPRSCPFCMHPVMHSVI